MTRKPTRILMIGVQTVGINLFRAQSFWSTFSIRMESIYSILFKNKIQGKSRDEKVKQ
jgi:hypothetical protein